METRRLSPRYSVSPQLLAEEMPAVAAAGFTCVICNRPDTEVEADLQHAAIGEAARAAGLDFHVLELSHQTLTLENAARQKAILDAVEGSVLAYCKSGNRSSVIWSLGQVASGAMGTDEIMAATTAAGYNLEQLRPAFEQLEAQRG